MPQLHSMVPNQPHEGLLDKAEKVKHPGGGYLKSAPRACVRSEHITAAKSPDSPVSCCRKVGMLQNVE